MSAHEQFADDLALYALEALDGSEKAAVEQHVATCAACRRELENLRGDMALAALSASVRGVPMRENEASPPRIVRPCVASPSDRPSATRCSPPETR